MYIIVVKEHLSSYVHTYVYACVSVWKCIPNTLLQDYVAWLGLAVKTLLIAEKYSDCQLRICQALKYISERRNQTQTSEIGAIQITLISVQQSYNINSFAPNTCPWIVELWRQWIFHTLVGKNFDFLFLISFTTLSYTAVFYLHIYIHIHGWKRNRTWQSYLSFY